MKWIKAEISGYSESELRILLEGLEIRTAPGSTDLSPAIDNLDRIKSVTKDVNSIIAVAFYESVFKRGIDYRHGEGKRLKYSVRKENEKQWYEGNTKKEATESRIESIEYLIKDNIANLYYKDINKPRPHGLFNLSALENIVGTEKFQEYKQQAEELLVGQL